MKLSKLSVIAMCVAMAAPIDVMAAHVTMASALEAASARTPDQKSADRALMKAVRRALAKTQGFDTSGVFVRARGGAVTLSGTVRSGDQIQVAEDVARGVQGVTSVTNKLALFHGGNG